MKLNTKVDERVKFTYVQPVVCQNGPAGSSVLTYAYYKFSPWSSTCFNLYSMAEWQARSGLYDEFKITNLKVSFKPYYTEITLNQQYSPQSAISNVDLHTIIDRDGTTAFSASLDIPSKLAMYDSYQRKNITKPWSRSLKTTAWMNTSALPASPGSVTSNQAMQYIVNNGLIQELVLFLYNIPNITANQAWGQVTVQFSVCFRGKKPATLSYDPLSGSTIITPLSSFSHTDDVLVPMNPSVQLVDHTLVCDEGVPRIQLTGPHVATGLPGPFAVAFVPPAYGPTGPTGPTGPGLMEV